jgi:hypothetical protein
MINRLFIGAALTVITAVTALAQDCPICPGGTNGTGGSYTNPPSPPQEYALDALLVRVASVATPGSTLVYTNYGWQTDTNNLLISAGASSFDSSTASGFQTLVYTVSVTNTRPSRVYQLQFSTNGAAGPYYDMLIPFYGTTNRSEYSVQLPLPNIGQLGLWRMKQMDGFVLYAMAASNGVNGGSSGGCPGAYHGYINYVRRATNGWGYTLDTNVVPHAATDQLQLTNRLELGTIYGYFICGSNTVSTTSNSVAVIGDRARFSVFFRNYPTNQAYPLWVKGFIEPTNAFTIPSPQIVSHSVIGPGPDPFYFEIQPFIEMDDIQKAGSGIDTYMTE